MMVFAGVCGRRCLVHYAVDQPCFSVPSLRAAGSSQQHQQHQQHVMSLWGLSRGGRAAAEDVG